MNIRHVVESGFTELLLAVLFTIFTLAGVEHPSILAYLAVGFAILAVGSALYSFRLRRQQLSYARAQGIRFRDGELQALPKIKEDISKMRAGDTVRICGTGATAVVYLATEVYQALRRGVNFEIYLINPTDFLVDRVASMEPDFIPRVFDPVIQQLRTDHSLRESLGADWTDKTLNLLTNEQNVCSLPHTGNSCSKHGRVICASADIWRRIAERVKRNDPNVHSGQVKVCYYRRIPFIKAWRFQPANGESWYYVADYLYYPGVGIDNPIRRVERHGSLDQHDTNAPGFINTDRIDAHFDSIDGDCEVLPSLTSALERAEVSAVSRKPFVASSPEGATTRPIGIDSSKSRKSPQKTVNG